MTGTKVKGRKALIVEARAKHVQPVPMEYRTAMKTALTVADPTVIHVSFLAQPVNISRDRNWPALTMMTGALYNGVPRGLSPS
jgi:hypothetical protein